MIGRVSVVLAAILGAVGVFLATQPQPVPVLRQHGRNNTVLFLCGSEPGLANIMVATGGALLTHHPDIDAHIASLPDLAERVSSMSRISQQHFSFAKAMTFHPIKGLSKLDALVIQQSGLKEAMKKLHHPPWFKGALGFARVLPATMMPWSGPQYHVLLSESLRVIDLVDPAVVVVDPMQGPALDAIELRGRRYVVLSPNAMRENIGTKQPGVAAIWKYPATGIGYPYPIPWYLIPANTLVNLYTGYSIVVNPNIAKVKEYLISKGFSGPRNILNLPCLTADLCISQALPEADFPMDIIPENFRAYGPIYSVTSPIEEQDPEMAAWLKRAPTVLVNLGSMFLFSEEAARELATALKIVFANSKAQVLWKLRKLDPYSDTFLHELVPEEIKSGRLRVEKWIKSEPAALLQSGHVAVSVHHGGASCYGEALASGVPQVVLPAWADCYDFASRAEMAGVGIWGSKTSAPDLNAEELSSSILTILGDGPTAKSIHDRAKSLGKVCQGKPGRFRAAEDIAQLARA